jgi:hypothetical protein
MSAVRHTIGEQSGTVSRQYSTVPPTAMRFPHRCRQCRGGSFDPPAFLHHSHPSHGPFALDLDSALDFALAVVNGR